MRGPHPFPARMAPDLALASVTNAAPGIVLDPMCGSGMALKAALRRGRPALGFDVDPLAVLMSRVWTATVPDDLAGAAERVITSAQRLRRVSLPWVDSHRETSDFIDYWFAPSQQHDLRRLAAILWGLPDDPQSNALRLALSRIIITKSRGASLASDVSHSRPHRTRATNDYDVIAGFRQAALTISKALTVAETSREASVELGDARNLSDVPDASIGVVLTSPPYLNAIDYLRGHRLALVWLGYSISRLREIRAESIGAERALERDKLEEPVVAEISEQFGVGALDRRLNGMLSRYIFDLARMMSECARVLQPNGDAILVVGNSTVRGQFVDNARLVEAAGSYAGLAIMTRDERPLPPNRRYLPPPKSDGAQLSKRMRSEVVLHMRKAA